MVFGLEGTPRRQTNSRNCLADLCCERNSRLESIKRRDSWSDGRDVEEFVPRYFMLNST